MQANGLAPNSLFANVSIAVDAHTLEAASGKRQLKTIEPDGELTYDEPKVPRAKRTEALERIWNEYPSGLLDLREETLRSADPTVVYGEDEVDARATDKASGVRESGRLMSTDEMESLRSEVYANLNDARNELWFIFELAKTLAASAGMTSDPPPEPIPSAPQPKKGKAKGGPTAAAATLGAAAASPADDEPPILPAGTYTTTPSDAPPKTPAQTAHALELALAAKQRALDDCVDLIDAAVDELRLMTSAGERFASDVHGLRLGDNGQGQYAVVPKPDFGRTAKADDTAKDVVIPYALDEAPPAIYARSLAAFDLDPRRADSLAFGARSHLRLRMLLRVGGPSSTQMGSTTYDARAEEMGPAHLRAAIEAAQLETVDEDLFAEMRAEASRMDGSAIEPQNVVLRIGRDKVTLQLYDTRDTPSPLAPHSPVCDALLAAARLGLMHSYKRRKQRLVEAGPTVLTAVTPHQSHSVQHAILLPLINLLQFHSVCRTVRPALAQFRETLSRAGIETAMVERHTAAGSSEAMLNLLNATAKIDVLGAVFTLEVEGCPGITVNVTAPASVNVVTPRATFPLRDVEALPQIVADALATQLSARAYRSLRINAPADAETNANTRVLFDELEGAVVAGVLGPLSITIPPPFTCLRVSVESDVAVAPYDSNQSENSADEWLQMLLQAIQEV